MFFKAVGGGRHPNEGHQAVADVFDVWNMVDRWQRLFRAQVTKRFALEFHLWSWLLHHGISGHELGTNNLQLKNWWFKDDKVVVSNIFYFHPYLGKIPILTNIFQMGWNHQLDEFPFGLRSFQELLLLVSGV